jgi:hypothetical protein
MPLNPYFTPYQETHGNTNEQNLYSDMIRENIEMSGQEYYYIPRTLSDKYDPIFGEDALSSFESYAKVVMWIENYNGFSGESEVLSKFGMEIRDSASFIIHRQEYADNVVPIVPDSRNEKLKFRPCEGDIIYVPFSQSLFQIRFVEDEYPGFYQLKKKYVWALRAELMQLNNEKFNTSVAEIDIFGTNVNRLNNCVVQENGDNLVFENGGFFVLEEYDVAKDTDDLLGYGDNNAIKNELVDIMDWSEDSPFGE